MTKNVEYLTPDEVLELHKVVEDHARTYLEEEGKDSSRASYGLRRDQEGVLESAVRRPQTDVFGQGFTTIPEKVAALTHGLTQNHCFINGNKRTALLAAVTFLAKNGYELVISERQARNLSNFWRATEAVVDSVLDHDAGDDTRGFILRYLYATGFRGLQEFLSDPSDDEITWGDRVSAKDTLVVPWNPGRQEFEAGFIDLDKGLNTLVDAAGENYRNYVLGRVLFAIFKQTYIVLQKDKEISVIPRKLGDDELPQDEAAVANASATSPIVIGEDEQYWELNSESRVLDRARKHFGGELDLSKIDRYEVIYRNIVQKEFLPSGLSLEIADEEKDETFQANLVMQIWPMHVDANVSKTYFPVQSHIIFKDGAPDFSNFDKESLKGLNESMSNALGELQEKAHQGFLNLTEEFASSVDESFESAEEDLPEDFKSGSSLEGPSLTTMGSYEPMWKFICRIDTEDLSIDEIASWFEERMRPLMRSHKR